MSVPLQRVFSLRPPLPLPPLDWLYQWSGCRCSYRPVGGRRTCRYITEVCKPLSQSNTTQNHNHALHTTSLILTLCQTVLDSTIHSILCLKFENYNLKNNFVGYDRTGIWSKTQKCGVNTLLSFSAVAETLRPSRASVNSLSNSEPSSSGNTNV